MRFGFLKRLRATAQALRRDQRGNTVLIMAAGMVPVGMAVAGGIDMTRAYMAQARLQQAVDTAALAGRKILTNTETGNTSTAGVEVKQFLDSNFPTGIYDHKNFTRSQALSTDGSFCVTASADIPTLLLGRFHTDATGISDVPISATSCARRSGSNIDVVLVLDVTGSMATSTASGGTRIQGLRQATKDFLATMDSTRTQLATVGLRVRVGIVPYNSTVNIGRLLVADVPYANGVPYIGTEALSGCDSVDVSGATANCLWTNIGWPPRWSSSNGGRWRNPTSSNSSNCEVTGARAMRPRTGTGCPTTAPDMFAQPDLTNFVSGAGAPGSSWTDAYKWKGCVEARPSVRSITSSTSKTSIPNGAWDILDVAPGATYNGSVAPAWRPFFAAPTSSNNYGPPGGVRPTSAPWNQLPWAVTGSSQTSGWQPSDSVAPTPSSSSDGSEDGPNRGCSSEARRLSSDAASTFTSYIDVLKPSGSTLHDIGMFWGIAMISPGAPFVNADKYIAPGFSDEPREVKRYIIFMTDGIMDPSETSYSAFGTEAWSYRLKSTTPTDDVHTKRFQMLCEYAKQKGISISTVSFGITGANSSEISAINNLKECASSTDQYYSASTATSLINIFKQIANNIGYLRVSQ